MAVATGLPSLIGADGLGATLARIVAVARPTRVVGGWATVELDRAEREVAATLRGGTDPNGDASVVAVDEDDALGARCRLVRAGAGNAVLLEPSTEGLLARALARHGEGWLVAYLMADREASDRLRSAGLTLAREARGPFGPERLVVAGPRSGPFVILVRSQDTGSGARSAG